MRVEPVPVPWEQGEVPSPRELDRILLGTWRDAATEYWSVRRARLSAGVRPPSGIQAFLNRRVDAAFAAAGWDGSGGQFIRDGDWVRVTFRHQMSLGSDLIAAQKVVAKSGVERAWILAAPLSFVTLITPNDANVVINFEKLWTAVSGLDGVVDIPLTLGRLDPVSKLPPEVAAGIRGPRGRPATG